MDATTTPEGVERVAELAREKKFLARQRFLHKPANGNFGYFRGLQRRSIKSPPINGKTSSGSLRGTKACERQ